MKNPPPFTVARVLLKHTKGINRSNQPVDLPYLEVILRLQTPTPSAQACWDDYDIPSLPEVAAHLNPSHGLFECTDVAECYNKDGIRYVRLNIRSYE